MIQDERATERDEVVLVGGMCWFNLAIKIIVL